MVAPTGSLPSSNFSSPYAGKLRLTMSGQFSGSTISGQVASTSAILSVKAFIGPPGSPTYTPIMEKYTGVCTVTLDYPGGNAVWPMGAVEVSHADPPGGVFAYGWSNIILEAELKKR